MATLSNIKRLVKDDFPQSDQDLVDRLAYVINPVLDQLVSAFDKDIDITNLTREYTTVTVTLNSTGQLNPPVSFKTALTNQIQGISVISASGINNVNNSVIYPTTAPFISWTITNNNNVNNTNKIIQITNVSGIQNNSTYSLTLEVIS